MIALTPIEEKRYSRYFVQMERYIDASATRFERPAETLLAAEGRRVAAAYERHGLAAALAEPESTPWMEYLQRLWMITAPDAAVLADEWIGAGKAKNPLREQTTASARAQIRRIGPDKAAGMVKTSQDMISGVLTAAEPGAGARSMFLALVNAYSSKKTKRSKRIAYSEVHESANYGTMEAATSLYRALDKIWVSMADGRVRDAHVAAHGQRRHLDQFFTIMGERLNFPGDSSLGAGPELTINCRCIVAYQSRNDRVR